MWSGDDVDGGDGSYTTGGGGNCIYSCLNGAYFTANDRRYQSGIYLFIADERTVCFGDQVCGAWTAALSPTVLTHEGGGGWSPPW